MESNFMIYLLLVVKLFHSTQTASYNRSCLRNSIIVIKKNPYGDIIIKSETVNMNSTNVFDDTPIHTNNTTSSAQNISSEYIDNAVSNNSSSDCSKESSLDSRFSFDQSVTPLSSIYNFTSNSTDSSIAQNITKRRSMLRRLFDKLI